VLVDVPPSPAPPEPGRPPVPAPPLPGPRPPVVPSTPPVACCVVPPVVPSTPPVACCVVPPVVPSTPPVACCVVPPVACCVVPPVAVVPPWLGAPPVLVAPPVDDCAPPVAAPPCPDAPPVSEEDELLEEQALPTIANRANSDRTTGAKVMNASLLFEGRSTAEAVNVDSLACDRNMHKVVRSAGTHSLFVTGRHRQPCSLRIRDRPGARRSLTSAAQQVGAAFELLQAALDCIGIGAKTAAGLCLL
jgi:hypothetical protein